MAAKKKAKARTIEGRNTPVKKLIELGQDKGYLLYDEIYELLPEEVVSVPDELDELYTRLGDLHILVIDRPERYQNREGDAVPTGHFDKKDEETAEFVLTAQEKTNDPVRMYLREMGTVPLLDREGEVAIAQRIENGEWMIYEALCSNKVVLRELLRLNELGSARRARPARAHLRRRRRARRQGQGAHQEEPADLRAHRRQRPPDPRPQASGRTQSTGTKRSSRRSTAKSTGSWPRSPRTSARSTSASRPATVWSTLLRTIHREFSRLKNDIRRATKALERASATRTCGLLNQRRLEKYSLRIDELEKRYGTTFEDVSETISKIRGARPSASAPRNS